MSEGARVVNRFEFVMPEYEEDEATIRSTGTSMFMCPKCGEIIVAELYVRVDDDDE